MMPFFFPGMIMALGKSLNSVCAHSYTSSASFIHRIPWYNWVLVLTCLAQLVQS